MIVTKEVNPCDMFFEDFQKGSTLYSEKQNIIQYRIGKSNQMHNLNYTVFMF